jgi:hypothetical protein
MNERRDSIRVHIEGKEYFVVGGAFQDMLAAVKQIRGRRFIGELKAWQLPGSAGNIQNQLDISGLRLEGGTPLAEEVISAQPSEPRSGSDRIRIRIKGQNLAVVGGTFQEMLAEVKNLPGRRFDAEQKIWEIPGDAGIILGLIQAAGFELEGAEKLSFDADPTMEAPIFNAADEPPPYEPPDFLDDDDAPPYEPPDWWDDEEMPAPMEPPGWLEEDMAAMPPEEPPLFPDEPSTPVPASHSRGGDQIRIRIGGIPMVVTGGDFKTMLEVVKKIPGRRFDGQDKVWDIPADIGIESVQQTVKAAGFVMKRG